MKFKDRTGYDHHVTLATGTAYFYPFPTGKEVALLYPPNDTSKARSRCFLHLWALPVMFIAAGAASIVFGLMTFAAAR